MSISEGLLPEFDQETATTRKLLEQVPEDKLQWGPHEKSMTLGRLAAHIAELPGWAPALLEQDEFDVAPPDGEGYSPPALDSVSAILETFDANVAKARSMLASTSDAAFMDAWTLKKGGEKLFSVPRIGMVRSMLMNHAIHHRGQLTVYLRLSGAAVPQSYGPTADFPDM